MSPRTWRCSCGAMYVAKVESCPACGDTPKTAATPRLIALVPSKSRAWVFHSIAIDRGRAICNCEAGKLDKPCRHVRDLASALAEAILGQKDDKRRGT